MQKIKNLLLSTLIIGFLNINNNLYAQSKSLDPAGYVNKYNPNFIGTGPTVYVLPAPRTQAIRLEDTFKELTADKKHLENFLLKDKILTAYTSLLNDSTINQAVAVLANSQNTGSILKEYAAQNTKNKYANLLNEWAKHQVSQNQFSLATNTLTQALSQDYNKYALLSNLSSAFLLENKYDEAGKAAESALEIAKNDNDLQKQATSHLQLALVQAYTKDYKSAENSIIRKAIPLFNKTKNFNGKIDAWTTIAEIYRLQNKFTEAQWFLIQAQELSEQHKNTTNRALIEYLLGDSKIGQNNFNVAKKELDKAFEFVDKTNQPILHLAILESLVKTNIKLKKYNEADALLDEYLKLRNASL